MSSNNFMLVNYRNSSLVAIVHLNRRFKWPQKRDVDTVNVTTVLTKAETPLQAHSKCTTRKIIYTLSVNEYKRIDAIFDSA